MTLEKTTGSDTAVPFKGITPRALQRLVNFLDIQLTVHWSQLSIAARLRGSLRRSIRVTPTIGQCFQSCLNEVEMLSTVSG